MKMSPSHDPMGQAIRDYYENGRASHPLRITSSLFEDDTMPVPHLFRTPAQMPALEQQALSLCQGRILDIGAGSGCHSLALQERGFDVTAFDISPLSVSTMRRRGVRNVFQADVWHDEPDGRFDTILFLMNGLGIAGTLPQLPALLTRCSQWLAKGGCLLADSSDLRYVFEDEEGHFNPADFAHYYGEVDYTMHYGPCSGPRFHWLYVDFATLQAVAANCGLRAELLAKGKHYDYLARITPTN